ncbi:MAG: T9SS type A sorting domain-containing protein, partial [Bacteroidota bacterium]
DSLISFNSNPSRYYFPINITEFIIDSDTLNELSSKCRYNGPQTDYLQLSMMSLQNIGTNYYFHDSYPIWASRYYDFNSNNTGGYSIMVNAYTGKCEERSYGVEENSNQKLQNFEIKSSPNSDLISIQTKNELMQNAFLRVYNQVGSLVFETKFESQSYQFSTASLTSGIYFLQLISGNKVETKPIIIVH